MSSGSVGSPLPLELICFGPPTVRVSGKAAPAEVLWRKNHALLVYLALSPGRKRTREHLIGQLWPERDQKHARRSFNEAIRLLRSSLGGDRILSDGPAVLLSERDLRVDALACERAALEDPEEALSLISGEFLEAFQIDDAPPFEDWLMLQRSHFREKAVDLLLEIGDAAVERSDFPTAQNAARRALDIEQFTERGVRLMMMSAALSGDTARALSAFSQFQNQISDELHEKPSRELEDLYERVRRGRWRRVFRGAAESEPPLVGRVEVHRTAFSQCRYGLGQGPRVLAITGGEGFGKTRLLAECIDRLALEGAVTAVARPLESDHDARFSTLRLLLRRDLASAPGVLGTSSEALAVLAAVEPEFGKTASAVSVQGTAQVASSLAACITAIAEEQPVALAIDDAQFADGPTLETIRAALEQVSGASVVVVLTAGVDTDDTPRELLALRAEIGRGLRGAAVELSPLESQDIASLVAALATWCPDAQQQARLARRLHFETSGNPMLTVTLLRALQEASELRKDLVVWPVPRATMSTPLPIAVPDIVRSAVAMRVSVLDPETARILKAASVFGQQVDPDLVAKALRLSGTEVDRALGDLERARFLMHDGTRFVFAAPLVSHVIAEFCLTKGERNNLQTRAIAALEERRDLVSQVHRAQVLAEAGRNEEAFELAIGAAKVALEQGTPRTARRSLQLAARVSLTSQQSIDLSSLQSRIEGEDPH